MNIKEQLDKDLKTAMLAGDKVLATTLRGLKSVVLYAEVAKGAREQGLNDEEIIELFSKESKKRQESAELYDQGGNAEKAQAERLEKQVIEKYLPKQLTDEELAVIVKEVEIELGGIQKAIMGQAIGAVRKRVGASAEGGRIATAVKVRVTEE